MSHWLANLELRDLLDHTVHDGEGETLGRIDDIIVNASDGRVEYMRLAVDTSTGVSYVTVPWSQLKLRDVDVDLTLEVSYATLRKLAAVRP